MVVFNRMQFLTYFQLQEVQSVPHVVGIKTIILTKPENIFYVNW